MFRVGTVHFSHWLQRTQFTGESYLQSMMGHGLRASSQSDLIDKLIGRGFLVVPDTFVSAMKTVDRVNFVPSNSSEVYSNTPQQLTNNHFMSTPQLHAQIVSLLSPRLGPGRTACELGCGSGYLPAVMAAVGCDKVIAVEKEPKFVELATTNLAPFPAVTVSTEIPVESSLDALYVSPFFSSEIEMNSFLSRFQFSEDALVVASVKDTPDGPLADQQLVLLERRRFDWKRTNLFRVLCEPLR